jgi:hypothetical protein
MIIRPSVVRDLFTSSTTVNIIAIDFFAVDGIAIDIYRCRCFGLPPPRGWIVQIGIPLHNCTRLGPTILRIRRCKPGNPAVYTKLPARVESNQLPETATG